MMTGADVAKLKAYVQVRSILLTEVLLQEICVPRTQMHGDRPETTLLPAQASDGGMQNRNASTVLLQVTHSNLVARFMEIRLDQHVRPGAILPSRLLH